MADSSLVEALKLAGGLAGLASAAFLIYDRLVRGTPIFAIHAKQGAPRSNSLYLRAKNVLDEDIVLDDWTIEPPLVGISIDNSVDGLAGAMIGEIPRTIMPPLGSKNFVLVILPAASGRETEAVHIVASWASTRQPWIFKRHVTIRTTVEKLKMWQEAHRPTPRKLPLSSHARGATIPPATTAGNGR